MPSSSLPLHHISPSFYPTLVPSCSIAFKQALAIRLWEWLPRTRAATRFADSWVHASADFSAKFCHGALAWQSPVCINSRHECDEHDDWTWYRKPSIFGRIWSKPHQCQDLNLAENISHWGEWSPMHSYNCPEEFYTEYIVAAAKCVSWSCARNLT